MEDPLIILNQTIKLDNEAEILRATLLDVFSQVVLLRQGYLSQQENITHDGCQSVWFHLAENSASQRAKVLKHSVLTECLSAY